MTRYSIFSLLSNARSGHREWPQAWRDPEPRQSYQVVIIGGGGHGLATADAEAFTLQVERTVHADDAGADHGHVAVRNSVSVHS